MVLVEEQLAQGKTEPEYDAWLINIFAGDQFGSGFKALNPNAKIPALVNKSTATPTLIDSKV